MRYPVETIEAVRKAVRKHLLGYRDNMRVEVEYDIPVTAKTVADLRAATKWPAGLVLDIRVDLDHRLSVACFIVKDSAGQKPRRGHELVRAGFPG